MTGATNVLARASGILQTCLPQHALSGLVHWLARREWRWLAQPWIRLFVRAFRVDLDEAVGAEPHDYPCFNAFFTRALQSGARPLVDGTYCVASPADGTVSQIGHLRNGQLLQAKGRYFEASALLGDDALAGELADGRFATIYLSPRNYHRVHMPVTGTLRSMTLIPGRLFSVNDTTSRGVRNLYARNERVVMAFDTDSGPLVLVMVGAMLVGSIETVWHGEVTPGGGRDVRHWSYRADGGITLRRGEELGRFNMGSTVILLAPSDALEWDPDLRSGSPLNMGQRIATRGADQSASDCTKTSASPSIPA